ncbi:MAG: Crp/Fnr family transcriptional regulator [Bryobacteraceae bacterium]
MPPSNTTPVPAGNRLLAALPADEYRRLLPSLEPVTLSLGEVLREPGGHQEHLYFPTTCVVSLLYTVEEGSTAGVGLTGNDGAFGVALFLGGDTSPYRIAVQIAGAAFKMTSKIVREEFARGCAFQRVLLAYTQALIIQISQTAACNRLHSVEKRLCRWLLMCHDRVPSGEILMTHEFISNMLGGRRESVTMAAGRLQETGLIQYSRGHIRILDRQGLEACACECYRVVKDEVDRLMGKLDPKLLARQAIAGRDGGREVS